MSEIKTTNILTVSNAAIKVPELSTFKNVNDIASYTDITSLSSIVDKKDQEIDKNITSLITACDVLSTEVASVSTMCIDNKYLADTDIQTLSTNIANINNQIQWLISMVFEIGYYVMSAPDYASAQNISSGFKATCNGYVALSFRTYGVHQVNVYVNGVLRFCDHEYPSHGQGGTCCTVPVRKGDTVTWSAYATDIAVFIPCTQLSIWNN